MKVLLVGSGGREHALAWKLSQSEHVSTLICAPGNAGIEEIATCVSIKADDVEAILNYVQNQGIEFVVVGPEAPLAKGLVDKLDEIGVPSFGPSQLAAQLESSKAFTKDFCTRHNIPTAAYGVFTDLKEAKAFLHKMTPPYVLKADGLAAGKGVVLPKTLEEAEAELEDFFSGRFGDASRKVVIEEFMEGEEASVFALADGKTALALRAAQDHKRVGDGDTGPNTGGMGAYSPTPAVSIDMLETVMETIIRPTVKGMAEEGYPFKGVLFAGLMMTREGPRLIEYNARFGDPECQVLMMRLESDLFELMRACHAGKLHDVPDVKWDPERAVTVVLASNGYPGSYEKGLPIYRLDKAANMEGVRIFHAGTKLDDDGQVVSNGGRVLNVTAKGETLHHAVERAYAAIDCIKWDGGFCRRDIAWRALKPRAGK